MDTQELQFIESCLRDDIRDFKINSFEHTNVIELTSLKDANKAKNILYVLCYQVEIVQGTNKKKFEVIFN